MKIHVLALTGLLAFWPAHAFAGWSYAQWGMTPDQLWKASHKRARAIYPEQEEGARKLYQARAFEMGLGFRAIFWFGPAEGPDKKLVRIVLEPDGPQKWSKRRVTAEMLRGLTREYGAPSEHGQGHWLWLTQDNRIALEPDSYGDPRIVYRPALR